MTQRVLGPKESPRRRWTVFVALTAVLAFGLLHIGTAGAVHDEGFFELEGDARNDLTATKLGVLQSSVTAGALTMNVCQTADPGTPPFTVIVDSEQIRIASTADASFGGNCSGVKKAYTVAAGGRGFNGPLGPSTAASHSGGADVTKLEGIDSNGPRAGDDWSNLWQGCFDGSDSGSTVPDNFDGCVFVNDKIGKEGDNTYFTGGGSKDRNDISQWQWTANDQSPDKNDIVNAFAAAYHTSGTPSRPLLYFGADRTSVSGDAQMAFWFLAVEVCLAGEALPGGGTCPNTNPGKFVDPETGDVASHSIGDILALVNFNNGGAIGLAGVYEWNGTEPVKVLFGDSADCTTIGGGDDFCTVANKSLLTFDPAWGPAPHELYGAKVGNATLRHYQASAFIEGGIDLSSIAGAATCFPTFIAETRSSSGPQTGDSLDAQLKDLAFGQFQQCDSEIETTPADGSGEELEGGEIEIGTGTAGVDVTDIADVTVNGIGTWSGTVSFFICGPLEAGELCEEGGVAAGTKGVSQSTTQVTSDPINLTEVGRYCWRGEFDSDTSGVDDQVDARESECFEVTPVTPELSTEAVDAEGNPLSGAVPFGQALYDKATLVGTAYQPGTDGADTDYPSIEATMDTPANGTITFTLVSQDDCDGDPAITGTGNNPETVDVEDEFGDPSGDGDYFTSGFAPDAPGDYTWKASYSGDSPNTNGASHNDACDEEAEHVSVEQIQPTMDTAQSFVPNDSATISVAGSGELDGDVVFKLYVDDSDCSGPAAYTSDPILVSDTDDSDGLSATVSSENETSYSDSGTTFHWVVEFTSDNSAHMDVTSGCGNEHSSITIDNGVTQPAAGP